MINTQNYYEEIQEITQSSNSLSSKSIQLKQLLERLSKEITKNESMQFSTLFSRLVFIAQKYDLSKQTEWQLQNFRVKVTELRRSNALINQKTFDQSVRAILELCDKELLTSTTSNDEMSNKKKTEIDVVTEQEYYVSYIAQSEPLKSEEYDTLRVQLLTIDSEKSLMVCAVESTPGKQVTVRYNVTPENIAFNESISRFSIGAQLNLIDCSTDELGYLIPKKFVFEPDYLIDASAISNCFYNFSVSHLNYFMNKFERVENRNYILLGNLANFFLDELIFVDNPDELTFDDVFFRSFKESPFEFASCEDIRLDKDFRSFMTKAATQFQNIKRVIRDDFPLQEINPRKSTLEPAFISEKYGFQGRLDLLQVGLNKEVNSKFKLIELKSGRLPYPNSDAGKVSLNHEVQVAIYRLMIKSVYDLEARDIDAAILYSAGIIPGQNLRFAAVYQALEKQILNVRNLIVSTEYSITQGTVAEVEAQFNSLSNLKYSSMRIPEFYVQKIKKIDDTLAQSTELERIYFYRFVQFITKELYLQKIGDIAHESPTGFAALWNSEFQERADALDLLYDLEIDAIVDTKRGMDITFKRTTQNNDLVNFREGDICIVYPRENEHDNVLNNQILKGVISSISGSEVVVYFRFKQRNKQHFDNHQHWAIEHDTLDSSYNGLYKSLFAFLSASREKRSLLLGITPPTSKEYQFNPSALHANDVIEKALASDNYFLIVGPPGTGKTSIFARQLIERYYADETKNILVLAYTNRAVNELCEAVNAAFGCTEGACDKFIRVGTELTCEEPYKHRLLQNIAEQALSREDLVKEIANTRIFISTLSSINGKQELFNLKKFDVAIIDEASQILEPQIVGVLTNVEKFILIGDHNQLATIVLQNENSSKVKEQSLIDIGMKDCRDSFFERLLHTCILNQWTHAYSQLIYQGRMHIDIAAFPSKYFYEENLLPAMDWQSQPLNLMDLQNNELDSWVAKNRLMFLSTEKIAEEATSNKINHSEAATIVKLVQSIKRVYEQSNKTFCASKVGIIAPYRNQIALIKQKLEEANIPGHDQISVDTVERYQGSQRDIILISFCVNKYYQLDYLCNLNRDGTVDRKLNVALTRARKQLFIVGNSHILNRHPIYATLLDFLKEKTLVLNE
ncbi:MAG: AAA domain-containing protein [Dysgonamonadaceae bacterium]|nr:AAA domain-containing protein [Dysgonamonadaceae bacterium]